ncbi:MAG: hypothetical protein RL224_154 [Actinomycetota bacterium]|jgi:hypothetical protein
MVMGLLLSILLIWPAYNQVLDEERPISQLDPTSLSYCELETCGYIEELGIEVLAPAKIREGAYGTEVWVQVVNKDRMSGTRQIWAELRSPEGKLVEGMRGELELSNSGPQFIRFFFTGQPEEFETLSFTLAY